MKRAFATQCYRLLERATRDLVVLGADSFRMRHTRHFPINYQKNHNTKEDTMNRIKFSVGAAALVAVAMMLTACSGPGASPTTPAGDVKVDEAARALLPESLKQENRIVIANDPNVGPPFGFIDPDSGEHVGTEVELAYAIGAKLGLEVEIVQVPFVSIISGVQAHKFDLGVSAVGVTPDRLEAINSVTYTSKIGVINLVRKGNPKNIPDTFEGLCGYTVGGTAGIYSQKYIEDVVNPACAADGKDPVDLKLYTDGATGPTSLQSGKIDVLTANSVNGLYIASLNPNEFEVQDNSFLALGTLGVALPKDNEDLSLAVEAAVRSLLSDGTLESIFTKWGIERFLPTEIELLQ
jgi:polar amino acid transport system substrate-binding protein